MDNFDYIFYTTYYSDLKNFDTIQALKHWNNYGEKEGRFKNVETLISSNQHISSLKFDYIFLY